MGVKNVGNQKAFPFGEGGFFIALQGDEKDGRGVTAVRIRRRVTVKRYIVPPSPAPFGGTLPKGEGYYFFRTSTNCAAATARMGATSIPIIPQRR